jgi:hypothetical protein
MSQKLDAGLHALREALYEMSMEQEVPDTRLLDNMVRRYPQFSAELTDFAVFLALEALGDRHEVEAVDPKAVSSAVNRSLKRFKERLHAPQSTAGPPRRAMAGDLRTPEPPNPFTTLDRRGFRALAERLNANAVFVCKLRDRQIDPDTIPLPFQQRVADELEIPLETVQAHFAARQSLPQQAQFFKADTKPVIGVQQSFEEAVRNSDLTEEQQTFLLAD